jgi:hypothetical protein
MQTYGGVEVNIAARILHFLTGRNLVAIFTFRPLYTEGKIPVPTV